MAYRQFYQPIDYSVADSDYISQGVAGIFNALNARRQSQQKAAEDFKYELKGESESDQKLLSEYAKAVFQRGFSEIQSGRGTSYETKKMMAQGQTYAEMSKLQKKEAEGLYKEISAREKDPYYNSAPALKGLRVAYEGENGEKNFLNRDLKSFAKSIDKVSVNPEESTFKQFQFRQDYVKSLKDKYVESSSKNPFVAKSKYNQAVFWDEEKNTPGVTDQHAIDYLKSDGRVDEYFSSAVESQLKDEIKRMKSSGDPRVAWMKGGNTINLTNGKYKGKELSDEEIMQQLIVDPSKNIINSKDFGVRKREMAKDDLKAADRVNSKVSVEYMAPKEAKNPDGTNDTIAHSTTFVKDAFNNSSIGPSTALSESASQLGISSPIIAGPGGNLMTKKGTNPGKPIVTDLSAGKAFNYGEGRSVSRQNGKFNITGYQLNAYDLNGNVKGIGGENTQQMIERINAMRPEDFVSMSPEMKISIKGYAIDDSKMLGDIAKETERINEEIADAELDGDDDKVERLRLRLSNLSNLRQMYNDPNMYDEDIVNSALAAGVKQIRVDQLLMANPADIDRINTITGLNLKDETKWSDDMKMVQQVYRQKYNDAKAKGFKSQDATEQKDDEMVSVVSPDGTTGRIPRKNLSAALKAGFKQSQ